jgi:hypothetical protein
MVMYWSLSNNKNIDSVKFSLSLAQRLVEKQSSGVSCPVHGNPLTELLPERLRELHIREHIPGTGKKAKPQRKCVVCTKHRERRESIYWCSECEAGLCLDECFKSYHTNLSF